MKLGSRLNMIQRLIISATMTSLPSHVITHRAISCVFCSKQIAGDVCRSTCFIAERFEGIFIFVFVVIAKICQKNFSFSIGTYVHLTLDHTALNFLTNGSW
jgi:hypothetical protein